MSRLNPLSLLGAVAFAAMLAFAPAAQATKLKQQNLTQLIGQAESIVAGTVRSVSDGLDANGVPYTEVTIAVGTTAKGKLKSGEDYTFRQFGLLEPRSFPNGRQMLAVSPEGFPRWSKDEYVVAFLYTPAARTGLQTTAGMAQGKLTSVNGRLANQFNNLGLFEGVEIDPALLNANETAMFETRGAVDTQVFLGLVGRAVAEGWIENGGMQ
jgi:hypothetical protein